MTEWRDRAACRGLGELFFDEPSACIAVSICSGCVVRGACLDAVMATERGPWRYGIVAGLTPGERSTLARRAEPTSVAVPAPARPRARARRASAWGQPGLRGTVVAPLQTWTKRELEAARA